MSVDPSTYAQGKINLLALTMLNGSGISAAQGAVLAKINLNSIPVVDYDGGRIDTLTKLASSDPSGLYSTPFGALSVLDTMYSSSGAAMLFGNCNSNSKYHYANVNASSQLVSLDSTVMSMMGASASTDLDASFQTMDQMTLSMLGNHQGSDFSNTANPYANYIGSNSFTLLLGIKHAA
jgi:aminoglycoside N3'-acetyltransferase